MYKLLKTGEVVFRYLVLILCVIVTIYPVIWMVAGSFKTEAEFYQNIWGFASEINFANYKAAWEHGSLGSKYTNTILVTGLFLIFSIPANCVAAYALARVQFKGSKWIYRFLLLGMMIPGGVLGMPTFTVALKLGLVNKLWGLSLIYAGQSVSFGVFLMRSFYISLPKSLEEAAMVDGCTRMRSFIRIILPLTMPGIVTQVVFNGLNVWNEYFLASIFIRSEENQTLPLGIIAFTGEYNIYYPELFAALTCATIPIIVVYLLAQRFFVDGMTAGAVKG